MKASFNYWGSMVPLRSLSKMSKACLISFTSSRGMVNVTQSSGLNFLGSGCLLLSIIQIFQLTITSQLAFICRADSPIPQAHIQSLSLRTFMENNLSPKLKINSKTKHKHTPKSISRKRIGLRPKENSPLCSHQSRRVATEIAEVVGSSSNNLMSPIFKYKILASSKSKERKATSNSYYKIRPVNTSKAPTETGLTLKKQERSEAKLKSKKKKKDSNELSNWSKYHQDDYNITQVKDKTVNQKIKGKRLAISKSTNYLCKKETKTQTFDTTPYVAGEKDIEVMGAIGEGTFGKVFKGRLIRTGQIVAVKRVYQNPKYKNREIQIVNMLQGSFVMRVLGTYTQKKGDQQYLNIVMEHFTQDVYNFLRECPKRRAAPLDLKLIAYQLFRGLMSIHRLQICHRDIKPQNLLIKGRKVVICDFGSAKILTPEPSLSYICSRCYRSPELIFGAVHYTTMIDIWSAGCVLLEMLNGAPLFIAENSIQHLVEIFKVLGTPTKTQVVDMNPEYDLSDYEFPKVKKRSWAKIFPKADKQLLDLIGSLLIYSPQQRLTAAEALCHPFFNELRDKATAERIQEVYNLQLLDFEEDELKYYQKLRTQLVPSWRSHYQ